MKTYPEFYRHAEKAAQDRYGISAEELFDGQENMKRAFYNGEPPVDAVADLGEKLGLTRREDWTPARSSQAMRRFTAARPYTR